MKNTCIVIVTYNGKRVLKDTIISLKNMTCQDFDVVVIDNASTDGTDTLLKQNFLDIIYLKQDYNWGFAKGCNIGIKYSLDNNYQYTLLLNNDVEVDEYLLARMIELSNENTIVVPKIYFYDKPTTIWYAGGEILYNRMESHNIGYGECDNGQYEKIREIEFLNGCCVLVHNNIWKKSGLFDEDYFMYFEDFDYGIRAKKNGIHILYQPRARVWHKVSTSTGGENSKMQVYYMTRNRLIFSKKNEEVFGIRAKAYAFIKNLIKIIIALVYKKNNRYIIKGYLDYKMGVVGKAREEI